MPRASERRFVWALEVLGQKKRRSLEDRRGWYGVGVTAWGWQVAGAICPKPP